MRQLILLCLAVLFGIWLFSGFIPRPMTPDSRLPTFHPITDGRQSASNQPASQTAPDSGGDGFEPVPNTALSPVEAHKYRQQLREASRALDENSCDEAAHRKAREAIVALIGNRRAAPAGPGQPGLIDEAQWRAACQGARR